jgi:hypothetical protein
MQRVDGRMTMRGGSNIECFFAEATREMFQPKGKEN